MGTLQLADSFAGNKKQFNIEFTLVSVQLNE